MTTLHLTLKITTAQGVEMSVTNNSLSKDYPHPDNHARQTTDTPEFKLFTNITNYYSRKRNKTTFEVKMGNIGCFVVTVVVILPSCHCCYCCLLGLLPHALQYRQDILLGASHTYKNCKFVRLTNAFLSMEFILLLFN